MSVQKSFLFFILLLCNVLVYAQEDSLHLPVIFSENMVIQQGIRSPVWGTGPAGETVMIEFAGTRSKTKVEANGKWMIRMPVLRAGGPFTMKITAGSQSVQFINVMVGEVWVCSGQSNMEMPLAVWGKVLEYQQEIEHANFPAIRLLQVQHATSDTLKNAVKVDGGKWLVCNPENIGNFSAVAYFFARSIYQQHHVSIGLIHSSWGGTVAEAWTSGVSLKTMPDFVDAVNKLEEDATQNATQPVPLEQQVQNWYQKVSAKDSGFNNGSPAWAALDENLNGWRSMKIPVLWESSGLKEFDGAVWFKKRLTLPSSWSGKELVLNLGPVDDEDITYFNGTVVGKDEGYDKPRQYKIPANLVKSGENEVLVRVLDYSGSGGIYGEAKQLNIKSSSGDSILLAGQWMYRVGVNLKGLPARPSETNGPNRPTVLYNAMINPLIPYGIRGAIWYQGESNTGRAGQYQTLFPLLIKDWRKNWKQGDFPFYYVQLANFMQRKEQPSTSSWAELREAQLKTLAVAKTGMAVAIDIGEEKDIHPKNKQDVGARLALIARAQVYGEKIPYSGPLYKSFKKEDAAIRISFSQTNGGLQWTGGEKLTGFSIAGDDKRFYWAEAKIIGDQVIVSSDQVPNPVAVRYGWADNPDCNLYNKANLPASPFRTDEW